MGGEIGGGAGLAAVGLLAGDTRCAETGWDEDPVAGFHLPRRGEEGCIVRWARTAAEGALAEPELAVISALCNCVIESSR